LIVAHPGHELRVHAWLEQARPTSFVLTQGDGPAGVSRLPSTTAVLTRAGAPVGGVYGLMKDREIYAALLERRHDVFLRILDALADALIASQPDCVVSDAEERYNPSHDVCRYLASAAAAIASQTAGREIEGFDFPLIGAPDNCAAELCSRARWIQLDEDALARKLWAAQTYPELSREVDAALATVGAQAFRTECLRPWTSPRAEDGTRPFYEVHGERQVAAGVYSDVIRLEHLLSLRDALWRHAGVEA
jgi:AcrR family transcriptional regulator